MIALVHMQVVGALQQAQVEMIVSWHLFSAASARTAEVAFEIETQTKVI